MRWQRAKTNRLNVRKRRERMPRSLSERVWKWSLVVAMTVGLGGLGWGGWTLFRSNRWFAISNIAIAGDLHRVRSDQLVALLDVGDHDTLLFFDLHAALGRIMSHPWVKSARIERGYPHTLVVTVLEQTPVAILATPQYSYVNREGVAFKVVEHGDSLNFPLLVLPANIDESSVSGIFEKSVHEMIDFLDKYAETAFAKKFGVSELVLRSEGFTCFTEHGGMQLEFGATNLDAELSKLDKYFPDIVAQSTTIGFLDLHVRGKIIASAKL